MRRGERMVADVPYSYVVKTSVVMTRGKNGSKRYDEMVKVAVLETCANGHLPKQISTRDPVVVRVLRVWDQVYVGSELDAVMVAATILRDDYRLAYSRGARGHREALGAYLQQGEYTVFRTDKKCAALSLRGYVFVAGHQPHLGSSTKWSTRYDCTRVASSSGRPGKSRGRTLWAVRPKSYVCITSKVGER